MSTYPADFSAATSPVGSTTLSEAGREALAALAAKGYRVVTGLTRADVATLHQLSLQPSIREYCPNDATSRFADEAATAQWLKKGRVVVLLIENRSDAIAGYGWFGDGTCEHIPEGRQTFAIRLSEAHQGRGLATPYTQVLLDLARTVYGANHIWLEAWASNAGAVHIYEKLGFQLAAKVECPRLTARGSETADTRLYLQ